MVSKTVRFHASVAVREVPRLANNQSDMRSLYYSKKDYENFKLQDKKIIKLMDESPFQVDTAFRCTRGLERRTIDGRRRKDFLRYESVMAVLSEQFVQNEIGEYNEDYLAGEYSEFSRPASLEAQDRANFDAVFAYKYVKEPCVAKSGLPSRLSKVFTLRQPSLRRVAGSAA